MEYVIGLRDADRAKPALAGGKGANLGALSEMPGIHVPDGFCITTRAFQRVAGQSAQLSALLEQLAALTVHDLAEIARLGAEIRYLIEETAIAGDIVDEIILSLAALGEEDAYAVRSSATAEDLPGASFAGQQDSFLNVTGPDAILAHVRKCWASLFTDRAISYRIRHGFDHRKVHLAVVVQKMVLAEASGVMFTADPVSGNRKVVAVDAVAGLGEALVGGLVNAEHYKVRGDEVIRTHGEVQVLTDAQIAELAQTGREIEQHFGMPQDIEWCLAQGQFYIVQSRPITTLFPIPETEDAGYRVYLSVGHQQMMTDAIKPLGISVWQMTALRPMYTAGGRLFVDVTDELASPIRREMLMNLAGKSDPLVKDALTTLLERGDVVQTPPEEESPAPVKAPAPHNYQAMLGYDPGIVPDLIARSQASIANLKQQIQGLSGQELIDFITSHSRSHRQEMAGSRSFGVLMTGINAAAWINDNMKEWLGETNAADTLAQSVPGNVTSEMGLALLDVADVVRDNPQVVSFLQNTDEGFSPNDLAGLPGGAAAKQAIEDFLDRYGMRCAGEIDITKTRWAEKPAMLVPLILGNVRNFPPGAGKAKFEEGMRQAVSKEKELTDRLLQLPDGHAKAAELQRMARLVRHYAGYREYPKYDMVSHYFIYKQALLREAQRLVNAGILSEKEDLYYLTLEETGEAGRTGKTDHALINQRKEAFNGFERLTPPRVLTSDGEVLNGRFRRDGLPQGAIVGLPVSTGIVEGRARVILNMAEADLEEGDILVTTFTDPSWTPLFVSIKGLVTQVGGLMTHGAVIAREYGLPAVVGIDDVTTLIRDGQRIRVNGTEGYVEVVPTNT
ncbi:putative phosphoenolpyruvate synthase [Dyadobacter beijingensis]|uniref:Phosphoenolpyruvate synthase n=2 Tax=Dyadobacter beijingensis TaxID=365489 RepID=A0ABQ2HVQ0_9BACT|nr:putative phosphoenolpyruvate synthase [Dyadobacter beijingensis]